MPQVTIENFVIDYQVMVTHTPGFEFDKQVFNMVMPRGVVKSRLLKPRDQIKMVATGDVTAGPGTHSLTLGFVQSLTGSSRHIVYKQVPHKFTQTHSAPYPIKDGSGEPWYKDDDDNLKEFESDSGATSFRVEVTDEPRFSFPIECATGPTKTLLDADEIKFHDKFVACFAAQVDEKVYCLHQIDWDMYIEGSATHLAQNGGIRVQGEHPLLPPYGVPMSIKLDGLPANRASRENFV